LGGVIIGISSYRIPVEGYEYITEESFQVLFGWIGAGVISGIMMFGFAEIVKLLDKILKVLKNDPDVDTKGINEHKDNPSKATQFVNDIINK
jgi:hypothetical protein